MISIKHAKKLLDDNVPIYVCDDSGNKYRVGKLYLNHNLLTTLESNELMDTDNLTFHKGAINGL